MDRRLVGVRNVRLLGLHHGEQEAVFADADEFPPFAKLRGLLADDVAGHRGGRHRLPFRDALLDQDLGFVIRHFEAGLLHELLEGIDAGLGPVFVGLLAIELVQLLAGLGDRLAFRRGLPLDLRSLAEDFVHHGGDVRGEPGAGFFPDAAVSENFVALALQVEVRLIGLGAKLLARAANGRIDEHAVALLLDAAKRLGLADAVDGRGRRGPTRSGCRRYVLWIL